MSHNNLVFLDYRRAQTGMLVKRSAHCIQQLILRGARKRQLGIITGLEFFDEDGQVICYPVVHWEGEPLEHICHPINVEPYRPHNLPHITLFKPAEARANG